MPSFNLAQTNPIFQPATRIITAITQAQNAQVTTSFANNYYTGDIVSFFIPLGFGMPQINGLNGVVTVISPTVFTVNIDSTRFDPFFDPGNNQCAQVLNAGEVATQVYGATYNTLPTLVRTQQNY